MGIDDKVIKEFSAFRQTVNKFRGKALRNGERYTDKSVIDTCFFEAYEKLLSVAPKPSVVEYGGGVPILSLFFLQNKQLSKLIVIDNDPCVLRQLDSVAHGLKVKVDVRNQDINSLKVFPDADVGVSFNALYGFSPTPEQMNCPPVLSRNVISEANHKAFGVFRHLSIDCAPWPEFEDVIDEMSARYVQIGKIAEPKMGLVSGYHNFGGFTKYLGDQQSPVCLYFVIGLDRKP